MPAKAALPLRLLTVALCLVPAAAFSQATASKMDGIALSNDKPIHIESDKLEIKDKENRADFTGNVVATQGTTMLKSNTMTVYYKSSGNASGGAMANAMLVTYPDLFAAGQVVGALPYGAAWF